MSRRVLLVAVAAVAVACTGTDATPEVAGSVLPPVVSPTPSPEPTPMPTPTPTATPTPAPSPDASPTTQAPGGERAQALGVSLVLPAGWSAVPDEPNRWAGDEGFVQIDAATGAPADVVCADQADHPLAPYGVSPTVEAVTIAGVQGCLVLPSDDQPEEMEDQAMAAFPLPTPVSQDGATYDIGVIYASTDHLRDLVATVDFVDG